jgi:hypothetical protein
MDFATWSEKGLNLCAVGDVSAEELQDFRKKYEAAAWSARSRASFLRFQMVAESRWPLRRASLP